MEMKQQEIIEEWKDIEGYEGKYLVSNIGRVKSLNYKRTCHEKILKSRKKCKAGYQFVTLYKNRNRRNFFVHRLVAQAFIPNPLHKPSIDHYDCNPLNNNVNNLRWCTQKENINNPQTIINKQNTIRNKAVFQFTLDGKFIREFKSISEAARQLGFPQGNISRCCNGKLNTVCGYLWRYTDTKHYIPIANQEDK